MDYPGNKGAVQYPSAVQPQVVQAGQPQVVQAQPVGQAMPYAGGLAMPQQGQPQVVYAQPVGAPPMRAQPMVMPMGPQPGGMAMAGGMGGMGMVTMGPPPGAPPGGVWMNDNYCGPVTICIAILICFPTCCCPCDTRTVYLAPNGQKFNEQGMILSDAC